VPVFWPPCMPNPVSLSIQMVDSPTPVFLILARHPFRWIPLGRSPSQPWCDMEPIGLIAGHFNGCIGCKHCTSIRLLENSERHKHGNKMSFSLRELSKNFFLNPKCEVSPQTSSNSIKRTKKLIMWVLPLPSFSDHFYNCITL